MSDTTTPPAKKAAPAKGDRLQHVAVETDGHVIDDVVIFGTELLALRHIVGKPGWEYVAVSHGQSVAEALKATS